MLNILFPYFHPCKQNLSPCESFILLPLKYVRNQFILKRMHDKTLLFFNETMLAFWGTGWITWNFSSQLLRLLNNTILMFIHLAIQGSTKIGDFDSHKMQHRWGKMLIDHQLSLQKEKQMWNTVPKRCFPSTVLLNITLSVGCRRC